jgi:hypothetical protein
MLNIASAELLRPELYYDYMINWLFITVISVRFRSKNTTRSATWRIIHIHLIFVEICDFHTVMTEFLQKWRSLIFTDKIWIFQTLFICFKKRLIMYADINVFTHKITKRLPTAKSISSIVNNIIRIWNYLC